ncbi:uncharacterized transporter YutK-like [Physella acuta]|uniref:uncharacterized transporter YutK-like n=1 Tax=Physella acuta TaxID=109671 RepID=UPI0027DC5982|nr:uncharacterized transporter YutK-like [Physella acuta]
MKNAGLENDASVIHISKLQQLPPSENGLIPLSFSSFNEKTQTPVPCIKQLIHNDTVTTDIDSTSVLVDNVKTANIDVDINAGDDPQGSVSRFDKYKKWIKWCIYVLLILGYFVYFGLALAWNFRQAIPVLVMTCLAVVVVAKRLGYRLYTRNSSSALFLRVSETKAAFSKVAAKFSDFLEKRPVKITCYVITVGAMLAYVVVKNYQNLDDLKPALGLFVIVFFSWLISYDRYKVKWRPVIWGLAMQMVLGLVVLRTAVGANVFSFLGHQIEIFLSYVNAGVLFVFGDRYEDFYFAFKLMPTIIFMSSVISVAYYLGAMQWVIHGISTVMSYTMGTTAAESTSTAACIFLGQPEASLTIKPFLHLMTRSELFAILTAGFASVTADVFSLFVNYGMSSSDIITAVLMSAPAGIAVSKLICPETEVTLTGSHKQIRATENTKAQNVIDAAITGAQDAVGIIVAVLATIIAFLSIFAFLNAVVSYLGSLVNIQGLTIDGIIAYPLMPVVYLMGVPWYDCRAVGEIVGLKTFVNELVGYQRLSEMVKAGEILSKRSEIVAMYALCGFSNPTSVGVALGGLSAMVPEKRMELAKIILMTWLAGCLACFMTASWAGLLYVEDLSTSVMNKTVSTP